VIESLLTGDPYNITTAHLSAVMKMSM